MNNLVRITKSEEFHRVFSAQEHRLIVILYTTRQKDCYQTMAALEKSALSHKLTTFCLIECDTFVGESVYLPHLRDINSMPRLDCFYKGTSIGTLPNTNEARIEDFVITGEGYIAKLAQNHYGTALNQTDPTLPTLKQMQYMFQIFQLMQQMGMLQPTAPIAPDSEAIVLDNGDKIIPLPDGRFKLIKKSP